MKHERVRGGGGGGEGGRLGEFPLDLELGAKFTNESRYSTQALFHSQNSTHSMVFHAHNKAACTVMSLDQFGSSRGPSKHTGPSATEAAPPVVLHIHFYTVWQPKLYVGDLCKSRNLWPM